MGSGSNREEGRTKKWGDATRNDAERLSLFLRLCASESFGSFIRKVSVWQQLAGTSATDWWAIIIQKYRRPDPRFYYAGAIKFFQTFGFSFFIFFLIQDSTPISLWPSVHVGWWRRDIFSSSLQVHHQFIATDCVRIHVAMDAEKRGMK